MQEATANLWIADVVHTSDISHYLDLKAKGMLAKHAPAGSERFRPELKDWDGFYTVLRGTPYVIAVNTQKVERADAPQRWKDLPDQTVPVDSAANAVLARAPHPDAARVFTDFLFGKEAQQLLVDDGLYVPSDEVTYAKDKRPHQGMKHLRADPEQDQKRSEEIKERFRELFGV